MRNTNLELRDDHANVAAVVLTGKQAIAYQHFRSIMKRFTLFISCFKKIPSCKTFIAFFHDPCRSSGWKYSFRRTFVQ